MDENLINQRTEEVQVIIDRMPTYWTKWIALCVGLLMGVVVLLGFLIQYPDTVDGQISVTAKTAPVRLVANSSGRILLLQVNNSTLPKGAVISYIESGANYKHILWVESILQDLSNCTTKKISLPNNLILGEVSDAYNGFMLAYLQYHRLISSDVYTTMRENIHGQIESDKAVINNLNDEILLKCQILNSSAEQLRRDSLLLAAKGISEQEFQRLHNAHLSLQEGCFNLQSSRQMKQSEVAHNQLEIQRLRLEEAETKEKTYSDFMSRKNELSNAISLWKERYLQYTPIAGELEYLGFWRNNSFVQAGQELFTIIPNRNNILGEVMIPSFGAGKVKVGQTANVKINNYPYDEYGLLKGVVKSVSRITNKLKTPNGEVDAYLVRISFPNGTVTNFGKTLPLDFESKGTIEIITKRKRLIERLFDNLKVITEK
ncbi:HlyD family efflux transporter periplasmic adaptor subunit [Hoylesella oralis]|uniref:HlyD family secretion protein n=1 Tax=Hoylesella oralis TaxID=28134 RepID=UPI0028EB3009|nr:HlyD family efflux transporter periplasmic adaptor subunit [Hoylesella oralis]